MAFTSVFKALLPIVAIFTATKASSAEVVLSSSEKTSKAILLDSLAAKGEWSSVHAAEYLIRLNDTAAVLSAFQPQKECETPRYRIGVWRVLAQAEATPELRSQYVARIRSVLLDHDAHDRLHALETLGKLQAPITSDAERKAVEEFAQAPDHPGRAFAIWRLLQQQSSPPHIQSLLAELEASDDARRLRAAFVLGHLNDLSPTIKAQIKQAYAAESDDSTAYPYLAFAVGDEAVAQLLKSDDSNQRALAWKELPTSELVAIADPADDLAEQSPLGLRQAAAYALLAKRRVAKTSSPEHKKADQ
ncbi:MAG: hypothetical protein ACIALR_12700 [Blastopirellula sp. JB062]